MFHIQFSHFLAWWSSFSCQMRCYGMPYTANIRLMSAVQQIWLNAVAWTARWTKKERDGEREKKQKDYVEKPILHSFKPRANYLIQIQNHYKFALEPRTITLRNSTFTAGKIEFITPYRMHKLFKPKSTRFYCDK